MAPILRAHETLRLLLSNFRPKEGIGNACNQSEAFLAETAKSLAFSLSEVAEARSKSNFFLHKTTPNPVKAITNFDVPIEWAEKLLESGVLEPDNPSALNIRSQDLLPKYYDAGLFYIYSKSNIKELMQNTYSSYQGFLMPRIQSVDIDTEDDWLVAEAFYKSLHG